MFRDMFRLSASRQWVLSSRPLVLGHNPSANLDCYAGFLSCVADAGGPTFIKLFVSMTAQILGSSQDITRPTKLGRNTFVLIGPNQSPLIIQRIIVLDTL